MTLMADVTLRPKRKNETISNSRSQTAHDCTQMGVHHLAIYRILHRFELHTGDLSRKSLPGKVKGTPVTAKKMARDVNNKTGISQRKLVKNVLSPGPTEKRKKVPKVSPDEKKRQVERTSKMTREILVNLELVREMGLQQSWVNSMNHTLL